MEWFDTALICDHFQTVYSDPSIPLIIVAFLAGAAFIKPFFWMAGRDYEWSMIGLLAVNCYLHVFVAFPFDLLWWFTGGFGASLGACGFLLWGTALWRFVKQARRNSQDHPPKH